MTNDPRVPEYRRAMPFLPRNYGCVARTRSSRVRFSSRKDLALRASGICGNHGDASIARERRGTSAHKGDDRSLLIAAGLGAEMKGRPKPPALVSIVRP